MNQFAFSTVAMIWGTTPLGVQWSAEGASPFIGALLRMLIAFSVIFMILSAFRITFPVHKRALKIYGVSVLGQGCAMLMVYWSSSYLPSSVISLLFGFSPLITGLLGWYLYRERLSFFQSLSICLGFIGLAVVFSKNLLMTYLGTDGSISQHYFHAIACMFLAVILFCLSNIWVKRFSTGVEIHPLAMTMGSVSLSLPLYIMCYLMGDMSVGEVSLTPKSTSAIIYLSIFGSVLAPYCFFLVLKSSSASMVALITIIAPVIALFLGAFLNNESIGPQVIVGALLVILSLLLYQFGEEIKRVLFPKIVVE